MGNANSSQSLQCYCPQYFGNEELFPLVIGDTCLYINNTNTPSSSHKLLIPGLPCSLACTISVLFDGSVSITKESSSYLTIWLNGSRVPAAAPVELNQNDVLVIGSLRYAFRVHTNTSEDNEGGGGEEEEEAASRHRPTIKAVTHAVFLTLVDVAFEVCQHGDVEVVIEAKGRQALRPEELVTPNALSLCAVSTNELVSWCKWLSGIEMSCSLYIDESTSKAMQEQPLIEMRVVQTLKAIRFKHSDASPASSSPSSSSSSSSSSSPGRARREKHVISLQLENAVKCSHAQLRDISSELFRMTQLADCATDAIRAAADLYNSQQQPQEQQEEEEEASALDPIARFLQEGMAEVPSPLLEQDGDRLSNVSKLLGFIFRQIRSLPFLKQMACSQWSAYCTRILIEKLIEPVLLNLDTAHQQQQKQQQQQQQSVRIQALTRCLGEVWKNFDHQQQQQRKQPKQMKQVEEKEEEEEEEEDDMEDLEQAMAASLECVFTLLIQHCLRSNSGSNNSSSSSSSSSSKNEASAAAAANFDVFVQSLQGLLEWRLPQQQRPPLLQIKTTASTASKRSPSVKPPSPSGGSPSTSKIPVRSPPNYTIPPPPAPPSSSSSSSSSSLWATRSPPPPGNPARGLVPQRKKSEGGRIPAPIVKKATAAEKVVVSVPRVTQFATRKMGFGDGGGDGDATTRDARDVDISSLAATMPETLPMPSCLQLNARLLRYNEGMLWFVFTHYCKKQLGSATVVVPTANTPREPRENKRLMTIDSCWIMLREFGVAPAYVNLSKLKELITCCDEQYTQPSYMSQDVGLLFSFLTLQKIMLYVADSLPEKFQYTDLDDHEILRTSLLLDVMNRSTGRVRVGVAASAILFQLALPPSLASSKQAEEGKQQQSPVFKVQRPIVKK